MTTPRWYAHPHNVKRGAEAEGLARWVAVLDGAVRAHPTQLFTFYDVWSPFGA